MDGRLPKSPVPEGFDPLMHAYARLLDTADQNAGIDPVLLRDLRMHITRRNNFTESQEAEWSVAYLGMVEQMLRSAGLGDRELAPLRDMADAVSRQTMAPIQDDDAWAEQYAVAAAEVAVLILRGSDEAEAAQRVARSLMSRGIPLPSRGGDARGWRRLLMFRDRVKNGLAGEAAQVAYQTELARLKSQRG